MTTCFDVARTRPVARLSSLLVTVALCEILNPDNAGAQQPAVPDAALERVEEIIVTARKFEESVQDLPLSVQVLSTELLDTLDLTNPLELQYNIPGLVLNNLGLNGAGYSLRGIASQGGTGQVVTTHLNGVYLGSASLSSARQFDLERIEVLKGPQGTLYGRNATGGTMSIVTRLPEDEAGGEVEVGYGSFETQRLQGYFNVPTDHVAFRLAYMLSEGDGFIRNSVDDRKFAEQDYWGLRASMLYDVNDAMRVTLMAQHVEDDGAVNELWLPRPDLLADPTDIRLTTVMLPDPFLELSSDVITFDVEYEMGFAKLHAISGYAGMEVRDVDDCAGLSFLAGCVRSALPDRHHQWSQEIRLVSNGGSPLEWLLGVSIYDDEGSRNYLELMPLINPAPKINRVSRSGSQVIAAFGQLYRQLGERWTVTIGMSTNREDTRFSTIGTGTDDPPALLTKSDNDTNVSWLLSVDFAASEQALVYSSVSTGFKSGGTTIRSGGIVDPFGPEHLMAWEAGVKYRQPVLGLTLNGAAFYYDFDDLQVSTSTITSEGFIFETDNAAKARIYGVDADASINLSDRLSATVGAVWLPERDFIEYRNDRTGDTLSGNKLTRTPEFTLTTALRYLWSWPSAGELSARLEYNYRSGYFYTVENDSLFAQSAFGLLNLFLNFEEPGERWYAFVSGRNLGNEDYFNQVFIQASPGYPDTYEAGFGIRF